MAVGGVHRVLTDAIVDPYYCCVPDLDKPGVAFFVETTHVDLVLSYINWRGATNVYSVHFLEKYLVVYCTTRQTHARGIAS